MSNLTPASAIPTLTIANRVFTDLDNLIYLVAWAATAKIGTFRKHSGTAGYTPSGSKTFKVKAIKFSSGTADANTALYLAYGDADLGLNSAAAITNPIYLGGASSVIIGSNAVIADPTNREIPVDFTVPNAKYLNFGNNTGVNLVVHVYGYEV